MRKRITQILAALLLTCAAIPAQTGPAGTWIVEGVGPGYPWEVILRVDGRPNRLLGAVSSCAAPFPFGFEIFDTTINGNAVSFKCKLFDDRTIAFQGNVNGNELTFTWELQGGNRDTNGPFGTDAPQRFTAKRVPDATDTLADKVNHMRRSPEVSFERIQHADREPQNWLTYSGTNLGHRFSPLTQINPDNVKNLKLEWLWQAQSQEKWEATPLVVDGILYTVQAPNNVVALNAETGQVIWTYPYSPKNFNVCCGSGNRGLAILGNTLFMGTLDAHLLAIDAYTGSLVWDRVVANSADPVCQIRDQCYAIDHAPLVTKDKVIVGTAGGDGRIRGFIAAFDARTGKEIWRFYTIPATGEPGNETWSGDSWKIGGAGVWNTGTYDPDSNLTYWGTGNPNPTDNANSRLGDNLYSDSVVALDADTGKLKWYFQFTAHDDMDWDAAQVPILADIEWRGQPRKVMLWPNRNGFFYVLDRITGKFLQGTPFVERNWASGLDENGRPVGQIQRDRSQSVIQSATNWYPPSYSPVTGLLYVGAEEGNRNPYGAVRALDPQTGEKKWEFRMNAAFFKAGVLTTASNLLFTGVEGQGAAGRLVDGNFYALDARTGSRLWEMALPRSVQSGPMSYAVGGKQYVAVSAGNTLFAFSLRQ